MAYIKKVQVPFAWTSLATLLDTSFESGHLYSIQALEGSSVRLCNATSEPTGASDGECIKNLMPAYYSTDEGTLYIRRDNSVPAFVVVSDLGE